MMLGKPADALSEAPTGPHRSVGSSPEVIVQRPSEKFADKVWRFLRNAVTGGIATVVLFAVYLPLKAIFGEQHNHTARSVGLVVGAVVQFLGCRYFVFRAAHGALRRQVFGFIFAELFTLGMNYMALQVAHWVLPREIDQNPLIPLATTFLVFFFFSYPVWHWVFKAPHTAEGVREAVERQTQRLERATGELRKQ